MNLKDKAKDIFDSAKEPAAEVVCSLFLEGVAGTVVPGVMSGMLAYKQKRQEKMFESFMLEIKDRVVELEKKLIELDPKSFLEFKDKYFGLISDYVLEEVQEEKIKYIANGFINVASIQGANEDFVLSYYDTLKELRIRDIGVLKFYYELNYFVRDRTYEDVLEEFNIDYSQYEAIKQRLLRMGLLESKRDQKEDKLYENILKLQEIIEKSSKGQKINSIRFNNLDKKDALSISKFGKEFVGFFMNEEI